MKNNRHFTIIIMNIMLVVGLVAIWIAFAPAKLGGQTSYIIVNGISMEPGFHGGDLVIARKASAYQVGEIITYRDANMGAHVIHRIIGTIEDRFITQGDNNVWIDDYQPVSNEIVGKLWIHLPKMGLALEWARTPINMMLITALLGGLFMVDYGMKTANNKKKKTAGNSAGVFNLALYTFGILALIFLALAVFSFGRPVMQAADNFEYSHIGVFSYSADGTSGVYDTDIVQSGEPVFTKLTCTLNLKSLYILQAEQWKFISGSQNFYAMVLDEQSGWQRTIPLTPVTAFTGTPYTSSAALDLCQINDLVSSVEKKTGFRLNSAYALVIVSHVNISGRISDQDFTDVFESKLVFKFDDLHYYIEEGASQSDPMQTDQPGAISNPSMEKNTIHLLGLNPSVRIVRIAAAFGLVISLGGLLALVIFYLIASKRSQETIIRIKYGSVLIDVYDKGLRTLAPIIDVASIDDLAKLAERQNTMIMHLEEDLAHYYLTQVDGTTYRYGTTNVKKQP
jgi:signal peptidase I